MAQLFTVIHLVLASGERLPCLVNSETYIPVRLATRWAVRYRRFRVQSSTLANNLRILGRIYTWALTVAGLDLDAHLTSGKILSARQIESLAAYLRVPGLSVITAASQHKQDDPKHVDIVDAGVYDHYLNIAREFLMWSLDSVNRGGASALTLERLAAERSQLSYLFASLRIGASRSRRIEPLTDHHIQDIRDAIGPKLDVSGQLVFPEQIFSKHTALRNWLMFETALELGLRRGELLKLRLDSLPRGSDDGIRILRHPDDPHDPRVREPAVKTAERAIPASRTLLSYLRVYLTSPQPFGRVRTKSIYLFVTRTGEPLSLDRADDIIQAISKYSGVTPLSWHRLRHTWAEKWAERNYMKANSLDRLMYLGGWTNSESPKHYIQNAIAQQAMDDLRNYHATLYNHED